MRRVTPMLIVAALCLTLGGVADAHVLRYGKAKSAAQNRADAFAGQATTIELIVRESNHRFFASAAWTRVNPVGCQECRWDPATRTLQPTPTTEHCYADLNIWIKPKRARKVRAGIGSSSCH